MESRYQFKRPEPHTWHWRQDCPFENLPAGCDLLIEAPAPFRVRWQNEDGDFAEVEDSKSIAFSMHGVRISRLMRRNSGQIRFQFVDAEETPVSEAEYRILFTDDKLDPKVPGRMQRSQTGAKNT